MRTTSLPRAAAAHSWLIGLLSVAAASALDYVIDVRDLFLPVMAAAAMVWALRGAAGRAGQ